jgi:hypothetical protein
VAEDHGTPGAEEIEVAIAVFVKEIRAFGSGEEGRVSAYGAKGPDRRVDASREKFFGAKLQLAGAGERAGHGSSIGGRAWPFDLGGKDAGSVIKSAFPAPTSDFPYSAS